MYRCDNGHIFDEPVIKTVHHTDPSGYEHLSVCPECENDSLTEVIVCEYCDKSVQADLTSEYITFKNGDVICNDCLHDYCENNFTQLN